MAITAILMIYALDGLWLISNTNYLMCELIFQSSGYKLKVITTEFLFIYKMSFLQVSFN